MITPIPNRPGSFLSDREDACPVCGYPVEVFTTAGDNAPRPGDPVYCLECTSLLCFTNEGVRILDQAQWNAYPSDFQEQLKRIGTNMVRRPIQDRRDRKHQHLIVPRGPVFHVAHLFANGLLVISESYSSRQAAKREFARSWMMPVTLTRGAHPVSRLWYAWATLSLFGQTTDLGHWGPYVTERQATEDVLSIEIPKLTKRLGIRELSAFKIDPRLEGEQN